jgi:hypothetical protein
MTPSISMLASRPSAWAMPVISRLCVRKSNVSPADEEADGSARVSASMATIPDAPGYGSDRHKTACTTLKMAAFTPMPSAMVEMTTAA